MRQRKTGGRLKSNENIILASSNQLSERLNFHLSFRWLLNTGLTVILTNEARLRQGLFEELGQYIFKYATYL